MKLARTGVLLYTVTDDHNTDNMQLQLINLDLIVFFYY
jgi:hypothetical protein